MTSSIQAMKHWPNGKQTITFFEVRLTETLIFIPRSDEALELSQIIKKLGLNKDICSREYLYKFFQTFYAQKNNIQQMDP